MMEEKYGLMCYPNEKYAYNVGDYIQSLAAKQYLPKVDYFIDRDGLSDFKKAKVKMIMNAFYMKYPSKWPPSNFIDPLFISVHINVKAKNLMLQKVGKEYLKNLGKPIGCRDNFTVELLQSYGIDAYFTGCLTTTLDLKYKSDKRTDKIYIVDPFYYNPELKDMLSSKKTFLNGVLNGTILKIGIKKKLMNKVFKKDLLQNAEYIYHWVSGRENEREKRFQMAEELLKKYASARLVITSRIHCALPCLALGTPVIFLNYGLERTESICRLDGIIDLFNVININEKGKLNANFELPDNKIGIDFELANPERHIPIAKALREKCISFSREN